VSRYRIAPVEITAEDKEAFVLAPITLNGAPARIISPRSAFANVSDKRTGLSAEWSWSAVRNVIAKGGAFWSY
jgi:hypothetical protein